MRLLVIEDDPQISQLLRVGLESEYFAVDIAQDGEKGLYLARINEYDVVILDALLPGRPGIEVCRLLREEGRKMPIIGLSIRSETANKIHFLNAGADDYVVKPFSFEELTARIRALLRRPRTLSPDIVSVGDLVLDTKRHIVSKNGVEIYLTRKEFLLLEYLMKNQGMVLTRGMILEHVWDMNADPFSNTIEAHVMSLRKKLGVHTTGSLIKTVSGVGYKIESVADVCS